MTLRSVLNLRVLYPIMRSSLIITICLSMFALSHGLMAQEESSFDVIINYIGEMESQKDPKCHATASRLEDFIYGTPLNFEARDRRIEFQQSHVRDIWLDYADRLAGSAVTVDKLALFKTAADKYFTYEESETGIQVNFHNGNTIFIASRDYRQYSSVAYSLRAILSVQQSYLFKPESLPALGDEQLDYFKKDIDIAILSVLAEADQLARQSNSPVIDVVHMDDAIAHLFTTDDKAQKISDEWVRFDNPTEQLEFLNAVIEQKLNAYQKYNQISQAVFLRNIQVYFSKVRWPIDKNESGALKALFTEAMIQFSVGLLEHAQTLALKEGKNAIQYKEVYQAVQRYLPHSINAFEDVTYFPNLDRMEQTSIEAYDLDAFRDSGLHWQYLKAALGDAKLQMAPDPYALEMLVEGIAQFAVLVFRLGGADTKANKQERLSTDNINWALMDIQRKLSGYPTQTPEVDKPKIISVETSVPNTSGQLFKDVSEQTNLEFEHRNSDWLSRLLRSYVFKKDENLARLGIPPAFGGGGVAAEDIDGDGWVDVLMLGGRGNQLLKNEGGERFVNITKTAGLDWQRADGNYGESRQPIISDFDNDGHQDIFISYADDLHRMYRNKGDGTFEDMTAHADLGGKGEIGGPCVAIDYDKDGLLDLYIGYFGNYLDGELPTLKRHNINGRPNQLFKNMGNFTFKNVSEGSGLENSGWTQAVGHSDINGDNWQDIIVGNDFGINAYYINNQDGTFTDISARIGTDKPSYTMNVGVGDLNRDLRPDFYISNIVVMEKDDKYVLPNENTPAHFDPASLGTMRVVEANDLFLSVLDEHGKLNYHKSTDVGRGYAATGWSWDADFFDFDNDTDDDLYCLTGMNPYSVYGPDNPYYTNPDGTVREVALAASNAEPNIFFENKNGVLEVLGETGGLNYEGTSRSAAYFDMDNDGDLDVVVNEYQGKAKLFQNLTNNNGNNWAKIKLLGNIDQKMTSDAIGASVVLTTPDGSQLWKEVYSATGYLSGHPKQLHFGLGAYKNFNLEIRWPNGEVQQIINLDCNQEHIIGTKN